MAINYANKIGESTAVTRTTRITLTAAVKAGSLIWLALAGKRSGSSLGVSSIVDSNGNHYEVDFYAGTYDAVGNAWLRVPQALGTADWIEVTWNGTPTAAWISIHAFEGADDAEIDKGASATTWSSTISKTIDVSGSDFLVVATIILPSDYGPSPETALNSMTKRDDNNATAAAPWASCFSRNYTTGSTFQAGASYSVNLSGRCAAASFPYKAMPAGTSQWILTGF